LRSELVPAQDWRGNSGTDLCPAPGVIPDLIGDPIYLAASDLFGFRENGYSEFKQSGSGNE